MFLSRNSALHEKFCSTKSSLKANLSSKLLLAVPKIKKAINPTLYQKYEIIPCVLFLNFNSMIKCFPISRYSEDKVPEIMT